MRKCVVCGGHYPAPAVVELAMRPGRLIHETVCIGCLPTVEEVWYLDHLSTLTNAGLKVVLSRCPKGQ